MTKPHFPNSRPAADPTPAPAPRHQRLITVACLGFFPLLYLLGKSLLTWLG